MCRRILFWKHRPDGDRIKSRDPVQQLMPYIMKTRNESCIYFKQELDLTTALRYIQDSNSLGPGKLTIFIIMLTAMLRTASQYPRLNRFIAGKRIYARNSMELTYIAKRDMSVEGSEVVIKQRFSPADTIEEVAKKVNMAVAKVRAGKEVDSDGLITFLLKLPGFIISTIICLGKILNNWGLLPSAIITSDPLFSSAFVANLGSIGLNAPFHHLFEWGTISLFIVIGEYKEDSSGKEPRTLVDVTFTIDERIADGYYFAQALKYFKYLVENPEELANPPERVIGDE